MYFVSTNSKSFPFFESETLYNENKKYFLPLDITFEELCNGLKGNCWAVMINNSLAGLIYFELKNGRWFLSGCSKRKMFKYVPKAISELCGLYFKQTDTIYSETEHEWAKQALKRAGFTRIANNLFMKGRK